MDMLISLTVVITTLHIHVSKHHTAHLKYIQFLSVTWTSKSLGRKKLPSTLPNSEPRDASFFPSKLNFLGKQSIPQSSCLHLFASSLLLNLLKAILKRHKDLYLSNPVFIVLFWFCFFKIVVIFSFFKNVFIYLFLSLAVLGLRFCARAFSSCGKRGPLFIAVSGPLTFVASLVAEHRLQTRRLSICGLRAQLLRSMWDLPRPGLEPMSTALAGGFSTTAPPGKPLNF